MAKHIPFVHGSRDIQLVRQFFGDSEGIRLSLQAGESVRKELPANSKVWVDAGVDGYHLWPEVSDGWKATFDGVPAGDKFGWSSFQAKPSSDVVDEFVGGVLDKCLRLEPDWISVPQLPAVSDSSRNRINRELARATAKWKAAKKFKGALVLPVIVTHQEQVNKKVERDKRRRLAAQCFERANADGYWVVDSSLADWTGSRTFEKRFKGIISLHEELAGELSEAAFSIGGPYWALNLVLWARGLVDYPGIGIGARYQYLLPGGTAKQAKSRVALVPLRRTAIVSAKLETWLKKLPNQPELRELRGLFKDNRPLRFHEAARAQVARSYKEWFDTIASAKPSGRALALFQDFSRAYVLGKGLDELPSEERTARRPERVAEQLMLFCMPSS